jgi:hypothetical protein
MTSHDEAMRAELEQVRNKLRAYASTGRLSNRYAEVLRKSLNDMADVVDGCLAALAQTVSGEVNQDPPNGYTIDEFISGVWSYSYTSETGQEMSGCAHWASYNLACLDAWGAYAESLEAKLKVQAASGDLEGACGPRDCGKPCKPVWILRFEDTDVADCVFRSEIEGRKAFDDAERSGWNCHLFGSVMRDTQPVAPTASGELVAIKLCSYGGPALNERVQCIRHGTVTGTYPTIDSGKFRVMFDDGEECVLPIDVASPQPPRPSVSVEALEVLADAWDKVCLPHSICVTHARELRALIAASKKV